MVARLGRIAEVRGSICLSSTHRRSAFLVSTISFLAYVVLGGPKLPPETEEIIDDVLRSELPELVLGQTGHAASDGLRIWYEAIKGEGAPHGTVLLVMANGGDALMWPPSFVRMLVEAGYRVIRFDHPGTGMSDRVENWTRKATYTLSDMARDAVAVMDALDVHAAHVVGLSMGGMIAQEIAIHHPRRVSSLTLLSTSGDVGDPDLPGLSSAFLIRSMLRGIPLLKYRVLGGERNLIKERIAKMLVTVGPDSVNITETATMVLYDLRRRRGVSIRGALQHQAAVAASASRHERLRDVDVPTLVVHGTEDEIIPVAHGTKLTRVMPSADGLWLDGVGHVFPYPDLDTVNEVIMAHLAAS